MLATKGWSRQEGTEKREREGDRVRGAGMLSLGDANSPAVTSPACQSFIISVDKTEAQNSHQQHDKLLQLLAQVAKTVFWFILIIKKTWSLNDTV